MYARGFTKVALASAFIGFVPAASASAATTINDISTSTFGTANCSSKSILGSIGNQSNAFAFPWVIQVGAGTGECIRLETTLAAVGDLEIVAVSPSGTLFRDDDGGAGDLSLVKIASAEGGFYTVQISHFAGDAIDANFRLRYGRYSSGNANCSSPTPPAAAVQRDVK